MIESSMFCDSSDGLVCYMKDKAIHVCNPITREHKMLQEAPRLIQGGSKFLINISVNLRAHKYNVSLLTFGSSGELSVQIYDSETMKWATSHTEVLTVTGWTIGRKKSVICHRVLYFLIDSTGGGRLERRLLAYVSLLVLSECSNPPVFVMTALCCCCVLDAKDYDAIHVCNPITREHKMLQEQPVLIERGCTVFINISVNLRAHKYNVSLLRFGYCGELSVQIYDSETMKWATSHTENLTGWKIRYKKSVICNRVLCFLIDSTGGGRLEHRLIAYDFSGNSSTHGTLLNSFIPMPCSDICGLMNLKGKLIIVAAIGSGRPWDSNNGFIIWLLKGKDWQEISRVTRTCFYGRNQIYGYSCSGADDLIYIHADYDPRLVVFDMELETMERLSEVPHERRSQRLLHRASAHLPLTVDTKLFSRQCLLYLKHYHLLRKRMKLEPT
ncbi:unnamed protein product [Rhodiola kirilowii]